MIIGTITIIIIVTDLIIENIISPADRFLHVRLPIAVTTHTHIIIMAMVMEIIMEMDMAMDMEMDMEIIPEVIMATTTAIIMDNRVANWQAATEAIAEIMAQDNPTAA